MKSTYIACLVVLVGFSVTANAQRSGTGVGVILGEPTGISLKHWMSPNTAIDGAAAWSLEGADEFQFHADYLFHNFSALQQDLKGQGSVYYGVGGLVRFKEDNGKGDDNDDTEVGIRFPIGIDYFLKQWPADIFMEIAPILDLLPGTEIDLNAGVGIRYYFQ